MKTSMKHITVPSKVTERPIGRVSVVTTGVYILLFGAWLALQLHK